MGWWTINAARGADVIGDEPLERAAFTAWNVANLRKEVSVHPLVSRRVRFTRNTPGIRI